MAIQQILGKVGVVPKGEYNGATRYTKLDIVKYNGQSYMALAETIGNLPTNTEYWQLLVEKPIKGIDYYTAQEQAEMVQDAITGITPTLNQKADKSEIPDVSDFITKDVNNLTNYYDKNAVDTKISAVYKYKGTVLTYNDLPSSNLTVGDVYNIETADSTHGIKAGDNVAWTGTTWDVLAGTVDLSSYQTKIDSSHKLASDLVDDTNSTHKFVTSEEKTQISTNATDIDNIKDGTEIDSFGDVETVLAEKQEQIDALVEENSTLKKQIPTAHISTTSTQLTNSAEGLPIENVALWGVTSQDVYQGYNLFNIADLTSKTIQGVSLSTNDNDITLSGTATGGALLEYNLTNPIVLSSGESITISKTAVTATGVTGNITLRDTSNNSVVQLSHLNQTITYSATADITLSKIVFYVSSGVTINYTFKLQIEKGATAHDWETYVGGQASPSPDYPQIVHKVTGNCNEKVQNKNFLPNLATSRRVNGINFVVNEDKSVTINGTATQLTYLVLTNSTNNLNNYTNKVFTMPDEFSRFPTGSNSVTYGFRDTSGNYLSGNNLASKDIGLVYLNIASGATINNLTVYPQIEKGSTPTNYVPHAEQNAPLSLGNIEAYEGDEIQIDFVQKAGHKKVTGARLVKNNAKIASYNGETITTEYKSTTGQLTTGATVVYKLATPDITEITDPTLLAQLETLINMKTYKEVTNIDLTGEDLAPVLEFNYYKDMTTIFDNLEARVELLEN